jgi:hypothetical protein
MCAFFLDLTVTVVLAEGKEAINPLPMLHRCSLPALGVLSCASDARPLPCMCVCISLYEPLASHVLLIRLMTPLLLVKCESLQD